MSGNSSIDTILLNLIENIRSEITSLNADLHGLEVNLKSIEILDQKHEHLKEKINNVVNKITSLEQKLDELLINSINSENVEKEFSELHTDIVKLQDRCTSLEIITRDLKKVEDERVSTNEKIMQFVIAIVLAVFGALISIYLN